MTRNLDLSLRGICRSWAYGPLMEAYAAKGDVSVTKRKEFWMEVQELIDMFACSWRRTTLTITVALAAHARVYEVTLETHFMHDHVCADCGHETVEQNGPCAKCGGPRIVLISFVEQHFGENWREAFDGEVQDVRNG